MLFHHLDTKALVSVQLRVPVVGSVLQPNRRCRAVLHVWLVGVAVARTRRSFALGWDGEPYYFFALQPYRR